MSEIDDIFASKGKAKDPLPSASSQPSKSNPSTSQPQSLKQKHKKKKGVKPPTTDIINSDVSATSKRPPPETIVDPSLPTSSVKRRKLDQSGSVTKKAKKDTQDEKFKDSRGSTSRRQTEEGWSIYKEDELGISNEGGDTPLCPFDCECCF